MVMLSGAWLQGEGHPGEGEDKHRGLEGRLSRDKVPGAVQEVTEGQSGRGWAREGLRVVT